MKRLLLALALLLAPASAFAQCSGNFPANSACGTVAGGLPGPLLFTTIGARERLVAARTYWVRPDGSDTNCTGLTNAAYSSGSYPQACAFGGGGAAASWAHAIDVVTKTLDFGAQNVTIQSGTVTTYTTEIDIETPWVGGGNLIFDLGGGGIAVTGLHKSFLANTHQPGTIFIQNVTLSADTYACVEEAGEGGIALGPNVIFNGCGEYDMEATNNGSFVSSEGVTYTIHGSAAGQLGHYAARDGGIVLAVAEIVNYTASATYVTAFAVANDGGYIAAGSGTFNLGGNTVTGTRFSVLDAGLIQTFASGIGYFPGTLPGVIDSSSTYDNSIPRGHGNTDYQLLPTDWYVYTTATLTAPRTWTLPAANTVSAGLPGIRIVDAFAGVTSTNTITVAHSGSDTINNSSSNPTISNAGGGIVLVSDGISNWGLPVQSVSTGGSGHNTFTAHGVLLGAGSAPFAATAAGATGQVLQGVTSSDPVWTGAPTLSTSLTSPLIYGGTAAGSTLALQSTSSGSPSGDTITLATGGVTQLTVSPTGLTTAITSTSTASTTVSAYASTITASPASSSSTAFVGGNFISQSSSGQPLTQPLLALQDQVLYSGTSTLTTGRAGAFSVSNSSSGTITNAQGFQSGIFNSGNGTITNALAVAISQPVGPFTAVTATFTNTIGLQIADQNPSTSGGGAVTLTNPPIALQIASQTASNAIAIQQAGSGLNTFAGASTFSNATIKLSGLANAAANEIVCFASASGLLTYEPSVATCVPSDPKLKIRGPNLSPSIALTKLETLEPGTGRFKPDANLGDTEQVWLYADQVCAMDSRLCVKDKQGILNYDKVGMLAYTVSAIKELQREVQRLKHR